ncbi:Tn3 family transposase [Streptomyces sp. NPDC018972]|uniref:Tn3 family transposase n=1 Tax=Streptomyces sp. NPDC018972 TaxID=3365060 RepID=UPI0037965B54
MTSIERTAYPRFKRLITAHELHLFFSPTRDELERAAGATDGDEYLLALPLMLKSCQRMGCFPALEDVPEQVVEFVRRAVELPEGTLPVYRAERTAKHHRGLVRKRVGVAYDQAEARRIAEQSIRKEAAAKNRPADLIDIALEKVVEAGLELPGFSTFDKTASKIRTEVNASICLGIHDRMSPLQRTELARLPEKRDGDGTTLFNRLKKPAEGPSRSHLKNLTKRMEWLDGLGDSVVWMDGVATRRITDFAGEADAGDAPALRDYTPVKRLALIACLVHKARMRVRDDPATMFCKRVATKIKKAKTELEEIRLAEQEITETLIGNYRTVLKDIDADGPARLALANAAETTAEFGAQFFRRQPEDKLRDAAAAADVGYPDNEGLVIDSETGIPSLKPHRSEGLTPSAKRLEQEIKARMPERTLIGILSRTAYWVEWWRRFGPASGNEPKLDDPFGRYVITTFVKGTSMGPYEAARHIPGVSGHELSYTADRHFSLVLLNEAIADLVDAHARLDISQAWGDGTTVAADGTHMDTYLALFTHFIPCGVWEAVYIVEGLLENTSEVKPTTVHADTQGQSQFRHLMRVVSPYARGRSPRPRC